MEKNLKLQIIGLERHRGINERAAMLGTENLDECTEDKGREYVEYLKQQPYPKQVENLRREVAERGLIGIKTKEGMKPYLTAEGAINQFRKDYPDAGIDLELIEFDDQKAVFKAEISNDEKLLASGYGMETLSFRKYFEKAQTSAIQRALKAIGYNTAHELTELSEQGYNVLNIADTSSVAAIPSDIAEQEHGIDMIDLVDQTRRRTKIASEKQIAIIKKKVDAGKIHEYFGKNPVLLTDGEANLAIKACFSEIDWDDVEKILSEVN